MAHSPARHRVSTSPALTTYMVPGRFEVSWDDKRPINGRGDRSVFQAYYRLKSEIGRSFQFSPCGPLTTPTYFAISHREVPHGIVQFVTCLRRQLPAWFEGLPCGISLLLDMFLRFRRPKCCRCVCRISTSILRLQEHRLDAGSRVGRPKFSGWPREAS